MGERICLIEDGSRQADKIETFGKNRIPNYKYNCYNTSRKEIEKDRKISLDKSESLWYLIQAPSETTQYRGVEQLAARRAHNPEVGGSSPSSATIKTPNFERNSVFF